MLTNINTFFTLIALIVGVIAALWCIETDTSTDTFLAEKEVLLSRDLITVFQYVNNWANYPNWYPGLENIVEEDSEPVSVGKHTYEVISLPIIGLIHYRNVITIHEPPHRFEWVDDSWLMLHHIVTLRKHESKPNHTHMTIEVRSRNPKLVLKHIMVYFFRVMYDQRMRQALFNLRTVMP